MGIYIYIYMPKPNKLYSLNICSLLYISIKLLGFFLKYLELV